jgi:hypothetical protein
VFQCQLHVTIWGQVDLHLDLDGAPGRSLRERCEHALRAAVRRLPAGTRQSPTRALATQLGVSRGVVVEAYAQLAAEGYLLTRRGGGTFVAGVPGAASSPTRGQLSPSSGDKSPPPSQWSQTHRIGAFLTTPPKFDLRPALPALDGAFRPAWARALGRAQRTTADARLGYPHPRGEPELRAALAASLARRRGVHATAAEVLVTGGLGPSLPFVWRLLAERGIRRVAIGDRRRRTRPAAGARPARARRPADARRLRPPPAPPSPPLPAPPRGTASCPRRAPAGPDRLGRRGRHALRPPPPARQRRARRGRSGPDAGHRPRPAREPGHPGWSSATPTCPKPSRRPPPRPSRPRSAPRDPRRRRWGCPYRGERRPYLQTPGCTLRQPRAEWESSPCRHHLPRPATRTSQAMTSHRTSSLSHAYTLPVVRELPPVASAAPSNAQTW